MPLSGGAADKYGNRYEGLWTVQCMIRILRDEYTSIYLEEPGQNDVEFRLTKADGVNELHQVKRQNGNEGRWRIGDLRSRDILGAFWACTANPLHKFVFISTDNVERLPELVDRANKSHGYENFLSTFLTTNKKLQQAFIEIKNCVDATDEEIFLRLKRLAIEPISETQLRRQVEWGIADFTNGNAANAVDILAQYALEQIHIELTRDPIVEHLREREIFRTTGLKLKGRKQYPLPQKPKPFISRASILRTLTQRFSSGTRIVLVKGVDGAGKTTLLFQFIEENPSDSFYFFVGKDWTSNSTAFLRDVCGQFQNELGENNSLDQLQYDELRDTFARLCSDIARLARQRRSPYYLIVDGLENVKEEPGRESIIDLIQLDFDGLFVLGSTNRDLLLHLPSFTEHLDYFTPADTKEYFADLGVTQGQLNDIYQISEGLPVYLDQLRREIEGGKPVLEVLNYLPTAFHDLLDRDWTTRSHSDEELNLLAMLAHAEMSFDEALLSAVTNIHKAKIQEILDDTQFVELQSITHYYRFVTDAHRSFVADKLADRVDYVNESLISYYQQEIFSEESLERLPLLLYLKRNKYEVLKSIVNINYLEKSLSITHDMSLLRRNTKLMIDAANQFGDIKDLPTVSKFSLISSLLKTFTEESADKFEVQALLAIGEYQRSLGLAYQAPVLEDKLELLAVIGRELKQNNGSLLENVVLELERMITDITPNVIVRERAVDIATDLFVVHPQAALDLLEKVADTDGKYSIDILLAVLALRLERDKQTIPDTLKSRIANEKLREFVTANSQSIANLPAEHAVVEAENLKDVSGQIFLLRSWCNENREHPEAINVIDKAIQIIQEAPSGEYSPSMLHLRQFAEPLLQYEYNEVSQIIETFRDIKAAALQQPFEETLRLELILLRLEGKNSKVKMQEQLLDLYVGLEQVKDLDVLCYCYVQILLNLEKLDPDDEMKLEEEINAQLPEKFEQLLLGSADQYRVAERILRALTKYDHQLALVFAQRLNTSSRRDAAYAEIMRIFVSKIDTLTDPSFLNEALNLVSDLKHQNLILVSLLRTFAEKFDLHDSPAVESFIARLREVNDPIDLAFGYCHAFSLSAKSGHISEAETCFEKMEDAWTQIELLSARVDVGFNLVILLSEQNDEKARQFYEIVSGDRKTHPLSNGTLVELYANVLNLSIRSVVAFKGRADFEDRLAEIVENIDQIPSQTVRSRHYADLYLRFYLHGLNQYSATILEERILPLMENCENVVDRIEMLSAVAPALFHAGRDQFNQAINELSSERDDVILSVIIHLISKQSPADPISLEQNTFTVDNAIASEVCGLIELLETDTVIHTAIRLLVEASIYEDRKPHDHKAEKCRLSEVTALTIARRLAVVIADKLPDSRNIQHDGFKISCFALLARLRDAAKRAKSRWDEIVPDWSEIIGKARNIPNVPDRILVLSWIADLKKDDESLARSLIEEAQRLVYTIPNVIDRSASLTEVAQAWHNLDDKHASKLLLTEAMKIIEGLNWDETRDQVAAQILQAAHAVDPALASSLTSLIENPLVQHRLQDRVFSKDLFREPHKLHLSANVIDYRPVISAAYEITRAMNSGTYHTILDNSIMQWLTISSELPFFMSFPVRLLEIQNYVGRSQNYTSKAHLTAVYSNLLDSLKLIGLISAELYPCDLSTISTTIPKSLRTVPIESTEHFSDYVEKWITETRNIERLEIYDQEFSYLNLNQILQCAKLAPVRVFTSWRVQGLSTNDTSVRDLFIGSWYELSEEAPCDLQIYFFESENGQCPIERRLYFLNGRKGMEIIPNRNYLEKAYLHVRELSADEAPQRAQECMHDFLISPIRIYRGEKVVRDTIIIN